MTHKLETVLVVLAKDDTTRSGFSVLVYENGELPTRPVDAEDEFLDSAVMSMYDATGLDVYMDLFYHWLGLRDSTEREIDGERVIAQPFLLIRQNKDKPFWLGVGFVRPHVPFVAPRNYYPNYLPYSKMELPPKWKAIGTTSPKLASITRPALT